MIVTREIYRVWPDGTVQAVADGEPHSWMSDDYRVVYANGENEAVATAFGKEIEKMNLRQALIEQGPSLALQRAAADEIAALDAMILTQRGMLAEMEELLGAVGAGGVGQPAKLKEDCRE